MSEREDRKAALDARHADIQRRGKELATEGLEMDPMMVSHKARILGAETKALADDYGKFLEDNASRKASLDARHAEIQQQQVDLAERIGEMDPLIAARRVRVLAAEAATLADEYEVWLKESDHEPEGR